VGLDLPELLKKGKVIMKLVKYVNDDLKFKYSIFNDNEQNLEKTRDEIRQKYRAELRELLQIN
jgi:hypothetical protein